jgi:hypothetical protein
MKPFKTYYSRQMFLIYILIGLMSAKIAVGYLLSRFGAGGDRAAMLTLITMALFALWCYQFSSGASGTTLPSLPTYDDIYAVMVARVAVIESSYRNLNELQGDTQAKPEFKIKASKKLLKQIGAQLTKLEQLTRLVTANPAPAGACTDYFASVLPRTEA